MAERWDSETTIKFIREYQRHEDLWSTKPTRHKRESAWQALVDSMGVEDIDVVDAKRKIRNLKSTFYQENCKIKKTAGYIPNLKWYPAMDSMLQHISTKLQSTMDQREMLQDSGDDDEISFDFSTTEDNELFSKVEEQPASYNKRKIIQDVTPEKKVANILKKPTIQVNQIQKESPPAVTVSSNQFDIFGTCVAAQLKALPMEKALVAQAEIQNLLSDHALRNLKSK